MAISNYFEYPFLFPNTPGALLFELRMHFPPDNFELFKKL